MIIYVISKIQSLDNCCVKGYRKIAFADLADPKSSRMDNK